MDFNTWKEFYGWGFATITQLREAVKEGLLTQDQFKEITGQDYVIESINKSINKDVVDHTDNDSKLNEKEGFMQKIFN